MSEITTVVCLKGRIREFGPSLELAPHITYIGRTLNRGNWNLARSDWANPFTAQKVGGAQRAVIRYREWLLAPEQAELRARIVPELRGRVLGCWCNVEAGDPCHGLVLVALAREQRRVRAGVL